MNNFIRKKATIFSMNRKKSNQNIFSFFFQLIFNFILRQFIFILDTLALLILSPLAILPKKNRKENNSAYFFSLEHVVDKLIIRSEHFKDKGHDILFFSFESTGIRSDKIDNKKIIKFHKILFFDSPMLIRHFLIASPAYVELYFEGNHIRQLLVSIFLSRKKTLMVCIDRGILGSIREYITEPAYFAWIRKWVYRRSQLIMYRDPDMKEILKTNDYRESKIIFDKNRVRIKLFNENEYLERNSRPVKKILYLNGFHMDRFPELLVKSIPFILAKEKHVEFVFVGSRSVVEEARVLDLAKELNVDKYVTLKSWNPDPSQFYEEALIYVMTAKYVYCNIALLEAMERGLVPIVSRVTHADLIVEDNVNGFLVADNEEDIAQRIIYLLQHKSIRINMGLAARDSIKKNYDIENRMQLIDSTLLEMRK